KLLLEGVEAAKGAVDSRSQVTRGCAAAAGAEKRPEETVVGVTAAVVNHGLALGFRHGLDGGQNFFHGLTVVVGEAFQRGYEPGHISGVMLAMENFRRPRVDGGFKLVECVGKWW